MKPDLSAMDVAQIERLITAAEAAIAAKAGGAILLWDGQCGQLRQQPDHGWLLHFECAIPDQRELWWHPSEESARADLHGIARHHRRAVDGDSVDLTVYGALPSTAYIEPV